MDERTEQLINRKLDGELTDAEALDLDKRLIKSPEARALLAELERNDALACRALRDALATGGCEWAEAHALPAQSKARRWSWSRAIMAVAACTALVVGLSELVRERGPQTQDSGGVSRMLVEAPAPSVPAGENWTMDTPLPADLLDSSLAGPRHVFGVVDDETESVYLLEIRQPPLKVVPVSVTY